MPGGNSTARPDNRKEKKAVKHKAATNRLADKLLDRRLEGDLSEGGYQSLMNDLIKGPRSRESRKVLRNRSDKELTRKVRKKEGFKEGGSVLAPKTSKRPPEGRKESSAPMTSKRPPAGKKIGVRGSPGIGRDAYSPADFDRLMDSQDAKMPQKFRDGGSVRGCKSGQLSGKGFSGSY